MLLLLYPLAAAPKPSKAGRAKSSDSCKTSGDLSDLVVCMTLFADMAPVSTSTVLGNRCFYVVLMPASAVTIGFVVGQAHTCFLNITFRHFYTVYMRKETLMFPKQQTSSTKAKLRPVMVTQDIDYRPGLPCPFSIQSEGLGPYSQTMRQALSHLRRTCVDSHCRY